MIYTNAIITTNRTIIDEIAFFYSQILFVNEITAIFTVFLIIKKCDLMN